MVKRIGDAIFCRECKRLFVIDHTGNERYCGPHCRKVSRLRRYRERHARVGRKDRVVKR